MDSSNDDDAAQHHAACVFMSPAAVIVCRLCGVPRVSFDIGAQQLAVGWTDPEFKADQRAFYYARVLEVPTPRWNTYDAVREKMQPLTKVPATIQDRAWSSPIWYTP